MRKNSSQQGFTLLEIIASLAILAIVLGYLLLLQEQNVDTALETHDGRMAKFLARSKMEEILLQGMQKIGSAGNFDNHPGFRWEATSAPTQPMENVEIEEITVTIIYGDQKQHKYVLKAWRHAPQLGGKNKSETNSETE